MLAAAFDKAQLSGLQSVIAGLYRALRSTDALLAEINPLAITEDGQVIAADAKFDLDDSSLFRHSDLAAWRAETITDPVERVAAERQVAYVRLDGNIGVIGNGAGLVMMTLDVIKQVGGTPANFLDIGGGAKADVVRSAIELVLTDPNVEGIVINIFGGITRGDEVAKGLLEAASTLNIPVPVAIRLAGTREAEAQALLRGSAFTPAADLETATRSLLDQIRSGPALTGAHA
jgi:succinyl-CoA synthetase beta subunit